ncbi:hypothetical protein [Paenibacillus chungangensis]|uniref:Uncharacterized protein n=1 Tax=Paenibacillus chungangensis TaxID=696535 RepID=A0ABW3HNU5_9BACL
MSYDVDEGTLQGMVGGGVGVAAEIPIYTGDYLLGYEVVEFKFKLLSPSYPMTVSEWEEHLGGSR